MRRPHTNTDLGPHVTRTQVVRLDLLLRVRQLQLNISLESRWIEQ